MGRNRFELNAANALLSILTLSLFYLIATHSLPANISETLPELALTLNGSSPNAATIYAGQKLTEDAERDGLSPEPGASDAKAKQPPPNLVALKELLQRAISRGPINPTAFRLLGEIASREARPKTAHRLMAEAVHLSLGEASAVAFLLNERLAADDPKVALGYADILMRSRSSALGPISQFVARLAENPKVQPELVARLAAAPPWRKQVLNSFASSGVTKLDAPLILLMALKKTPNPPTEEEVSGYVNLLLKWKLYALAYSTWVQFLDADRFKEVANVFNGSFEREPSGLPFDWVIGANAETLAGIFALPEDQSRSALFVRFGQVRSSFPTIRQMVVLPPGIYTFMGKLRGEILARRGLQWRVTCVDGKGAGESQMLVGRFPDWVGFSFKMSIPELGCPAQTIELQHMARTPSEQTASGSVWFDDLTITSDIAPASSP